MLECWTEPFLFSQVAHITPNFSGLSSLCQGPKGGGEIVQAFGTMFSYLPLLLFPSIKSPNNSLFPHCGILPVASCQVPLCILELWKYPQDGMGTHWALWEMDLN